MMPGVLSCTAHIVVERAISCRKATAALVRIEPTAPSSSVEIELDRHLLILHERGDTAHTTIDVDGFGRESVGNTRGCVGLIPAGRRAIGCSKFDRSLRHVAILIEPNLLCEDTAGEAPTLQPSLKLPDPTLKSHIEALGRELVDPAPLCTLYAESLVAAAAVQLVRAHSTASKAPRLARGGLPPRRLRRILDFVEANLEQEVSLATLTEIAGLSQTHFMRAFRQSVGQSPHQYVIQRRIERAKQYLATSDMPIAEVAVAVGFASQSHLTTHFGRALGTTPRRFRVAA